MEEKFVDLFAQTELQLHKKRHSHARVIKAEWIAGEQLPSFAEKLTSTAEPQILLKKNGDVIEAIEFRCSCGQRAHVFLEYDSPRIQEKKLVPGEKAH